LKSVNTVFPHEPTDHDSEVVHEQEQQVQQQAEEAEQEEETISVPSRDKEESIPWNVELKTAVLVMELLSNVEVCPDDSGKKLEMEAPLARYVVALSLAEAETVRRMVHVCPGVLYPCAIALRTIDGKVIDRSPHFFEEEVKENGMVDQALSCLKKSTLLSRSELIKEIHLWVKMAF